jgi:hypothetical protein
LTMRVSLYYNNGANIDASGCFNDCPKTIVLLASYLRSLNLIKYLTYHTFNTHHTYAQTHNY